MARRIGQYEIVRRLGAGGMAEVFHAQAQSAGIRRDVVVKRMLPALSNDPHALAMFREEARLSCAIRHPNVVHVYELLEDHGELSLVMELLRGVSLDVILSRLRQTGEAFPVEVSARLIAEACAGLHAAHELTDETGALGLVHRDISPQNLFITVDGVVKVLDFGIARARDRLVKTDTGLVRGKLRYMSPEQASAAPINRRADLYALGVVLWECLTGRPLHARDTPLAVLKAILEEPILPPSRLADVPPELDAICLKALAADPAQRYATAFELRTELLHFAGQRSTAPPEATLSRLVAEARAAAPAEEPAGIDVVLETSALGAQATPATAPEPTPPPALGRRALTLAAVVTVIGVVGAVALREHTPRPADPAVVAAPNPAVITAPAPAPPAPEPPPAAPSPPVLAVLKLDTTPSGARVRRDGSLIGQTPLVLEFDAPPTLALELDGYLSESVSPVARPGETVTLVVPLKAKAKPKPQQPTKEDPLHIKW